MKKLKLTKVIAGSLIVASVLALNPIGASAAWKSDSTGWWYTEGSGFSTGWKQINGFWYYFDSNGYMKTGWVQSGLTWYYLKDNGIMATENLSIQGKSYQFSSDGKWINNATTSSNENSLNKTQYQNIQRNQTEDTIIKVPANPTKGFNYPYYLRIPKQNGQPLSNYMVVESNNSGMANDSLSFHDEKAKQSIMGNAIGAGVSHNLTAAFLMPVFPRSLTDWKTYTHDLDRDTMLIKSGDLNRIDEQLVNMIKDAQESLNSNGINVENKVFMTGFSASSKFANKFAAIHPEIIRAVATGGVNASTIIPTAKLNGETLRYPVGVADLKELTGNDFNEAEYKKVSQFIYMGSIDDNDITQFADGYDTQDAELTWNILGKKMMPDRWNKLQQVYASLGYDNSIQTHTYQGIGHEITQNVMEDVTNFLKANSGIENKKIQAHINGK